MDFEIVASTLKSLVIFVHDFNKYDVHKVSHGNKIYKDE